MLTDDDLGAIFELEFLAAFRDVTLDGIFGDVEPPSHVFVQQTTRYERKYFAFTYGKLRSAADLKSPAKYVPFSSDLTTRHGAEGVSKTVALVLFMDVTTVSGAQHL